MLMVKLLRLIIKRNIKMKRTTILLILLVQAVVGFSQNSALLGPWKLVSIDNIYPDGSRVHPYGENPVGLLIFDEHNNYAIQILKESRPQIASGNKNTCTPEEYASIVKGSNSHFGTYKMDKKHQKISFNIQHASFPNWENTVQNRSYTLKNGVLTYVVSRTTQGGQSVIAEVVWAKIETD